MIVPIPVYWDGVRVGRIPSPEEIRCLELASHGYTSGVIGSRLDPPARRHTVDKMLSTAASKMGVKFQAPSVYQAARLGLVSCDRSPHLLPVLSDRQRQALDLVTRRGLTAAQVAAELNIGVRTVSTRLAESYQLLGARSRPHSLRLALERGEFDLEPIRELWRGVV